MMKQLKIKDNSEKSKEEFSAIPKTVSMIADKTLSQLEKDGVFVFPELVNDTSGLSKEQIVLQSFNDSFRTGNVMGFLGYGKERLVIESRFGSENNDFFLQYLLEKVLNCPNIFDLESDANTENQILDLFIFLFPQYLKNAMRKGLFKSYIRVDYSDCNPKGTINVARHIKENTPFVGNIAYSQREYSFDNYLTELIRHTIEFIRRKPYGRYMLSKVKDEVNAVVEATGKYQLFDRQRILSENKKHVIRHAFYREYRALQFLCVLILQNQKQGIGSGNNHVYGILFDGAWLWEEYVNSLVSEYFYHPMNKARQGAQRLFSQHIGLIYPDFISRDKDFRIIADAKYKPISNIGNHDYFQVLAYMMRFDAKKGMYFYPEKSNENDDMYLWLNKGTTYENNVVKRNDVCLIKHGLIIPQSAENYNDFSLKMNLAENDFKQMICDQVSTIREGGND